MSMEAAHQPGQGTRDRLSGERVPARRCPRRPPESMHCRPCASVRDPAAAATLGQVCRNHPHAAGSIAVQPGPGRARRRSSRIRRVATPALGGSVAAPPTTIRRAAVGSATTCVPVRLRVVRGEAPGERGLCSAFAGRVPAARIAPTRQPRPLRPERAASITGTARSCPRPSARQRLQELCRGHRPRLRDCAGCSAKSFRAGSSLALAGPALMVPSGDRPTTRLLNRSAGRRSG